MTITLDSKMYVEFMCDICGNVVYMKKKDIPKPQKNEGVNDINLRRKRDLFYSHIEGS